MTSPLERHARGIGPGLQNKVRANPFTAGRHLVMADQPTPTSSLEEARKALYARLLGLERHRQAEVPQWRVSRELGYSAIADAGVRSLEAAVGDAFGAYDRLIEAAARAEVIREVETAVYELGRIEHLCVVDTNTALKPEERAYVAMCVANARTALRALSQGGEG